MELTPQLPKSVTVESLSTKPGFLQNIFQISWNLITWLKLKANIWCDKRHEFSSTKVSSHAEERSCFFGEWETIHYSSLKVRMPVKRRQTWEPMGMSRPWSQWRSYPRGGWGAGRILIGSRPSMIFFNFLAKKIVQHPSENNTGDWSFMWALFRRGCLSY